MKVMRPVIISNVVSYLQMRLVGSLSLLEREREEEKERTGMEEF